MASAASDKDKIDIEETFDGTGSSTQAEDLPEGTRVHRYLILGLVGKGGMGAVYKAYDPELDRRIAIKILTLTPQEGETASIPQSRLMREAQALAKLNHPHVVSVFDVGTHQDGVYIAMEYVEGKTLRAWLKQDQPTQQQIREVFVKAGRGLQAAHAEGIVHRDFKPENLLVGKEGQVKVLDFGLARAADLEAIPPATLAVRSQLESHSGEQLLSQPITQVGAFIGTIAYMSPEHFQHLELDEKTDQFSFCVTLFEAFYGERPFPGKTTTELEENVTAGRIRNLDEGNLPTWLQQVIHKGLSVSKADRYPSMEELLAALDDDPLIAQAARRKKLWLTCLTLFLAALPFGIWSVFFKATDVCNRAQTEVAAVWNQDRKENIRLAFTKTKLSYANDSFERIGSRLDDYTKRWIAEYTQTCQATYVHGDLPVETMALKLGCLAKHLIRVETLAEALSAADKTVVAKSVQAVSALPAISNCNDIQALQNRIRPPKNKQTKIAVDKVRNRLIQVNTLQLLGKYQAGAQLAGTTVVEAEKTGYGPIQAEAKYWLGLMQERTAAYQAAKQTLQDAVFLAEESRLLEIKAKALIELVGVVGLRLSQFQEALSLNRWAKATVKSLEDNQDIKSLWLKMLGSVFWQKGDFQSAITFFEKALDSLKSEKNSQNLRLASILNNLGLAYYHLGDYQQARTCYQKSLNLWTNTLGTRHPSMAIAHHNLGMVFYELGDYDQAIKRYQMSLDIDLEVLGPDHPELAVTLNNLGRVFWSLGDDNQALKHYKRSLKIREQALGKDNLEVAFALQDIALLWSSRGELGRAQALFERALAIWNKSYGPNHQYVSWPLAGLGWIHLHKGQLEPAISHFERVLRICGQNKCKNDEGESFSGTHLGLALALAQANQDRPRATKLAKKGRKLLRAQHSHNAHKLLAKCVEFLDNQN